MFPVLHQDGRPGEWLDWASGAEAGPATEIMGMRMDLVYRRLDGSGLGGLEDIPEADAGLRLLGLSGRESVPVGELAAVLDPLERGSVYMGQCLEYISCAVEIAEGERGLRELVRRYGGSEEERMMTTLTEKWKAEGLAKGQAEGLAKGQAEGLAKGQAEGQARSLLLQMGRSRNRCASAWPGRRRRNSMPGSSGYSTRGASTRCWPRHRDADEYRLWWKRRATRFLNGAVLSKLPRNLAIATPQAARSCRQ